VTRAEAGGWRRLWRHRWARAAVVAVAVGAWPACQSSETVEGAAPLNFTLKNMSGQDVRLAEFVGRPIVLNFWATWCGPCRVEIPWLVDLQARYKDRGLVILGISTDDGPDDLRKFAADFKMNYPVLVGLGQQKLLDAYDAVNLLPVTWFVKADGTLAGKGIGIHSKEWFDDQIQALF
jgi:cytochrome c biogenesis protein CcmG/thiol:disulfide interchange protein DsbE